MRAPFFTAITDALFTIFFLAALGLSVAAQIIAISKLWRAGKDDAVVVEPEPGL